jgi:hypothetical protein
VKQKRKEPQDLVAERKQLAKEAKRARYDPEKQKSALQIQQERSAQRVAASDGDVDRFSFVMDTEGLHAGDTDEDDGEVEDNEDDDEDDDDGDADSYETLPTSAKSSEELSMEKSPAFNSPIPVAAAPIGVFDLRARLQAKIQGLQAQRKASQSRDGHRAQGTGDDAESTASTKDELLEERRKKRGEMRDKRRKAAKERKRAEKEQTTSASKSSNGNEKKGSSAPGLLVAPAKGRQTSSTASVVHSSGISSDLAFSTMHFEGESAKKSKHALPTDPKAALAVLEARKRKDEKYQAKRDAQRLSKDDQAYGTEVEQGHAERAKWSKAEAAAQGVKIREDENLLKKALKRKEKQKSQSTKEWKKRGRDIESQQVARQKKRTDNIAARKERKTKGGKGGKSSSASSVKGKLLGSRKGGAGKPSAGRANKKARPGFEGKRSGSGKKAGGSGKKGGGGK